MPDELFMKKFVLCIANQLLESTHKSVFTHHRFYRILLSGRRKDVWGFIILPLHQFPSITSSKYHTEVQCAYYSNISARQVPDSPPPF